MATSSPSQEPLTQAAVTLRLVQSRVSTLHHGTTLLSQYLDPSPRVSLVSAARTGSVRLLERVASHLLNNQEIHEAILDYRFVRAMEAAIEKNDLAMVQRIHALHPEPLVVKSLTASLQHGTLEMVQWVVEHRHDRVCCSPGEANLCRHCLVDAVLHTVRITAHDSCAVVQWLFHQGLSPFPDSSVARGPILRAVATSVELVKRLKDAGALYRETERKVLEAAVRQASSSNLEVIQFFADNGCVLNEVTMKQALISASLHAESTEVVEYIVNSGLCAPFRHKFVYASARPGGPKFIQWDRDHISPGDRNLYRCFIEGTRWIHSRLLPTQEQIGRISDKREDDWLDLNAWLLAMHWDAWSTDDMDYAASRGFLRVVQWLHVNRHEGCTEAAMNRAAANDHLPIVKWLHAHRAATNGDLRIVQWLHANRSENNTLTAMLAAAASGRLEMLVWLHENGSQGCTSCIMQTLLHTSDQRDDAIASWPVIDDLRWLRDHLPDPDSACRGRCLGRLYESASMLLCTATMYGDLQLLEYLSSHHHEVIQRNTEGLRRWVSLSKHAGVQQWARLLTQDGHQHPLGRFISVGI